MKVKGGEAVKQPTKNFGKRYKKYEEEMKIFFQKEKREEKERIDDLQAKRVLHPIMEECIRMALERAVKL